MVSFSLPGIIVIAPATILAAGAIIGAKSIALAVYIFLGGLVLSQVAGQRMERPMA